MDGLLEIQKAHKSPSIMYNLTALNTHLNPLKGAVCSFLVGYVFIKW